MLNMGNPVLARLFTPALWGEDEPPVPITTASAADAIARMDQDLVDRLYHYQLDLMERSGPPGWASFNEAERDGAYRADAVRFLLENPGTGLALTAHRALGYFFTSWPMTGALLLLALGGALSLRDRRTWCLWALVLALPVPYVLTMPVFHRHRYPIEPLLALLGALALTSVARRFRRRPNATCHRTNPTASGTARHDALPWRCTCDVR
jgi:hypothetical protein